MATSPERPRPEYRRSATGASEEIATQIRRWLEEQRLEPGQRIGTEQEMADEFGVSRPTLREALRLLSASHLIRVGRGRSGGMFVASTPSEGMSRNVSESIALMLAAESISMEELVDARLSLEVPLAGRAAVNADAEVVRPPGGGDRGRGRATGRARRRSTPPTAASTRSSPRPRATTCCSR